MKDIGKKTNEKEDPAVEQFCSVLVRIALQVARRCEREESILNENANAFGRGDRFGDDLHLPENPIETKKR